MAVGVILIGGVAFACTPIKGEMTVQAITGEGGTPTGNPSATVGSYGNSMEFCPGVPIVGGAAHHQSTTAVSRWIRIQVAPAACPTSLQPFGATPATNNLGTDALAEINFHRNVFDISGGSYSYTINGTGTNDCMTDPDNPDVVNMGTMSVAAGVGTKDVQVPTSAVLPDNASGDAAGVCVDAFDPNADDIPLLGGGARGLAMAPLVIL